VKPTKNKIILPLPEVDLVVVDKLDETNDRNGGFGSTGVSESDKAISPKMIKYGSEDAG
jgi:hypothetical protein